MAYVQYKAGAEPIVAKQTLPPESLESAELPQDLASTLQAKQCRVLNIEQVQVFMPTSGSKKSVS